MANKGNAIAKLTHLNGISGIDLYLPHYYGHYPLDLNFDGGGQLASAVLDAKDYGYDGIQIVSSDYKPRA